MAYCWEVYQKSECNACKFFQTYQSGNYDMDKLKDIILVDPEEMTPPAEPFVTNTQN